MAKATQNNKIHQLFEIGIIFKCLFALLETIGGLLAYFVSRDYVVSLILKLTQHELNEDPKDLLVNFLLAKSGGILSSQHFLGLYLMSHGIVKLLLIIALLKRQLWSYPVSMLIFAGFIVYQLYSYSHTASVWLLILTVVDAIVIWLIWKEYKYLKAYAK